jgi:hypothetical protein
MCHLSYARVPPVTTEAQAFALFAADELLKAGNDSSRLDEGPWP